MLNVFLLPLGFLLLSSCEILQIFLRTFVDTKLLNCTWSVFLHCPGCIALLISSRCGDEKGRPAWLGLRAGVAVWRGRRCFCYNAAFSDSTSIAPPMRSLFHCILSWRTASHLICDHTITKIPRRFRAQDLRQQG
jgi:hypothetical protein